MKFSKHVNSLKELSFFFMSLRFTSHRY